MFSDSCGEDFFVKFTVYRNPNFDPMDDIYAVALENSGVGVNGDGVGVNGDGVGVNRDRSCILRMIQENPHITAKELASRLHMTTRNAERIFRQLKQCGVIRREGSGKNGQWIIQST